MTDNKQKVVNSLTEIEVKTILKSKEAPAKWLFEFLYYTGLRVSEALNINIGDVYNGYLEIKGKGNKIRVIPITTKTKRVIDKLIKHAEKYCNIDATTPLFVSQKAKRLSRTQAYTLIKQFEALIKRPVRLSPHTLRHTFATVMLKNNVPVKHVSTCLGHASVSTTQDIYQHSTLEDVENAYNLL